MSATNSNTTISFRIPGNWEEPRKLVEALPDDHRLTAHSLVLPDGQEVEFNAVPPDEHFADVFQSSCRTPLSEGEAAAVNSYTVNVVLSGPGGSLENARAMMRAASAIIRAGGAGVFIDNSALGHAGHVWLEMTDTDDVDAMSFAFVSVVNGESKIWTMGMQALGFADLEMDHACGRGDDVIEVLRYICSSDRPVVDGHIIASEDGPRYQIVAKKDSMSPSGSPMFNPHGRYQMKSVRRVAEEN